jgi:hypothetical protein
MARYIMPTYRILEATDGDEYDALQQEQDLYWSILNCGWIDFQDGSRAKALLWDLFGEETATRANMEALEKPPPIEE